MECGLGNLRMRKIRIMEISRRPIEALFENVPTKRRARFLEKLVDISRGDAQVSSNVIDSETLAVDLFVDCPV
jgi:hypothetical protein